MSATLSFATFLCEVLLRSLALFAVAGVALLCLRRASAAARHQALLVLILGLLGLPLLTLCLPRWQLPVAPPRPLVVLTGTPVQQPSHLPELPRELSPAPTVTPSLPIVAPPPPQRSTSTPWHFWIVAVWGLGAITCLAWMGSGLRGVTRLRRRCRPAPERVAHPVTEIAVALGVWRPVTVCVVPEGDVTPMTWGWRRPSLVLPSIATDWPEGRLRAILTHELAHVRRNDWLAQTAAQVACAFYWFHPLVWWAARRLRYEAERACDDQVLSTGVPAAEYATHLLEVIRAMRPNRLSRLAAVPFARWSQLEARLRAVLDPHANRRAMSRRMVALAAGTGLALLVPLSVATLGARSAAARPQPGPSAPDAKAAQKEAEAQLAAAARQRAELAQRLAEAERLRDQGFARQREIDAAREQLAAADAAVAAARARADRRAKDADRAAMIDNSRRQPPARERDRQPSRNSTQRELNELKAELARVNAELQLLRQALRGQKGLAEDREDLQFRLEHLLLDRALAERTYQIVKQQYEAGQIPVLEVERAELQRKRVDIDIRATERKLRNYQEPDDRASEQLKSRIATLAIMLAEARQKFADEHPRIRTLQQELAVVQQALAERRGAK